MGHTLPPKCSSDAMPMRSLSAAASTAATSASSSRHALSDASRASRDTHRRCPCHFPIFSKIAVCVARTYLPGSAKHARPSTWSGAGIPPAATHASTNRSKRCESTALVSGVSSSSKRNSSDSNGCSTLHSNGTPLRYRRPLPSVGAALAPRWWRLIAVVDGGLPRLCKHAAPVASHVHFEVFHHRPKRFLCGIFKEVPVFKPKRAASCRHMVRVPTLAASPLLRVEVCVSAAHLPTEPRHGCVNCNC